MNASTGRNGEHASPRATEGDWEVAMSWGQFEAMTQEIARLRAAVESLRAVLHGLDVTDPPDGVFTMRIEAPAWCRHFGECVATTTTSCSGCLESRA